MDCTAASELEKLGTTVAAACAWQGVRSRSEAMAVSATWRLLLSSESSRDMLRSCRGTGSTMPIKCDGLINVEAKRVQWFSDQWQEHTTMESVTWSHKINTGLIYIYIYIYENPSNVVSPRERS